ncbi:MAG: hypothetical protein EA381_18530 [Planctomycetaceae bacterium]|nr:MAG: hypothetical protein EA381_18530 [Planctomycetaceae bacterium]
MCFPERSATTIAVLREREIVFCGDVVVSTRVLVVGLGSCGWVVFNSNRFVGIADSWLGRSTSRV